MTGIFLQTCNLCGSDKIEKLDESHCICKCTSCGYVFDSPRPSSTEIQDYYSRREKYDEWLKNLESRERLWKRRLKSIRKWKKDGSLLDIGTGIGQFLHVCRNDFSEVQGTEISRSAIMIAKERYGLDIFQGSIETIDFPRKKFDNITIIHVLEHVDNPREVIRKCHALLTGGGRLFIAVPNDIRSFRARLNELIRRVGFCHQRAGGIYGLPRIVLDGSIDEIHISHFTPDVLCSMLNREGFRVLELSLDPFFTSTGIRRLAREAYYHFNLMMVSIIGVNMYTTTWIVAEKDDKS